MFLGLVSTLEDQGDQDSILEERPSNPAKLARSRLFAIHLLGAPTDETARRLDETKGMKSNED